MYFNADERYPKVLFPEVQLHAPNTLQTPDPLEPHVRRAVPAHPMGPRGQSKGPQHQLCVQVRHTVLAHVL